MIKVYRYDNNNQRAALLLITYLIRSAKYLRITRREIIVRFRTHY